MRPTSERRSPALGVVRVIVVAGVLALACAPARAQAPSCAWGDGVTLPVSGQPGVLLANDGSAGVLAFTWPWSSWKVPSHGVLRMFHVLEQGVLDPSLPDTGAAVLSGADLDGKV